MREADELIAFAESGVKAALARGADAAEVFVSESRATRAFAAGRRLTATQTSDVALGVRVVSAGRIGISGASRPEGLDAAIARALASVKDVAAKSDFAGFAAPPPDARPRVAIDPRLADDRSAGLSALAESIMAAALGAPRVTYAQLTLASTHRRVAVANSAGHAAWDESANERAELELRCTSGTTHRAGTDAAFARTPMESQLDVPAFTGGLAERAASALESRPLDSAVTEAILLPAPLAQIVGMVAPSLCARITKDGVDAAAGALGSDVYAPLVSLSEEPRGPSGFRRRNVDDEGTPTRDTALVSGGRLVGVLHDARTAARAGVAPTGNGMRGGASTSPAPSSINLSMAAGGATLDELIAGAERAVLVAEPLLGGFTNNKSTGDFSVVVPYAFLIEGGKVRHPLPPTTIGGNAHRVLREVRAVGKERQARGTATLPAARAGGVSCAT